MNSTPRRLRTSACAVLVGAALVTTACGTDAESRDAAITAIGDVLYDNSSPGTAAAALQALRVPDDFAVLRVYGNCSTDSGTLLRTGDRAHLIEQFEELQRVCVRESIIVEVWVAQRGGPPQRLCGCRRRAGSDPVRLGA
ncbi:MAG: hypothetical protein H0V69_14055, partial [Acidimicrobiia bacterium]|nr:hypothetical protein [Acidimicrobiia bacterium]